MFWWRSSLRPFKLSPAIGGFWRNVWLNKDWEFQNLGFANKKLSFVILGARKSTQTFLGQSFSRTLRVMDVRTKNRGRPHREVRFPAAPLVGRNFLTPGHPGVRVRNVRRKFGPKSLCLCCFFFPEISRFSQKNDGNHENDEDGSDSHKQRG